MRIRLLLGALLALFATAAAAACDPQATGPIIDVHLHVYPDGEPMLAGRPHPVTRVPSPIQTSLAHRQATLATMRRCGVVRAVVSSSRADVASLAFTAAAEAPGVILAGHKIDIPSAGDLAAIRREAAAGTLALIGEISSQYMGVKPDDARMEPLWRLAEELDIPVGLHMGPGGEAVAYGRAVGYRMADSDALLLEPVLLRHPKMRVFVMHAGWPMGDQMIGLMYAHPQVYVDISADNWIVPEAQFHSYLKRLVDAGYGKRIMYGTDQLGWLENIDHGITAVADADFLTPEQKRDIFYNNAVRFFGWKDLPPVGDGGPRDPRNARPPGPAGARR
jgi:predicted TIM-barrel fold metal-dependent hydrolase